jgi:FkbM family methyltransferase
MQQFLKGLKRPRGFSKVLSLSKGNLQISTWAERNPREGGILFSDLEMPRGSRMSFNTTIKRYLKNRGWYVRKTAGLANGVDLFCDLQKLEISPKCIFDIGAHHGQTAIEYSRAFPSARIFAFEPVSSNYAELAKAAARNPQINPVRAAIGDKRGKLNIRLNPENSQAHSFKWAPGDQAEIVDLVTIDEFCLEWKLFPDFMKDRR